MKQIDKDTIEGFSDYVKREGKLAFEKWRMVQIEGWGQDSALAKNRILNFINSHYGNRYHRYFSNCGKHLETPDVYQEWKYLDFDGVGEIDSSGKPFSGLELVQTVYVFLVLVCDWADEEFEKLQGIAKPTKELGQGSSRNPWGLTNDQVVLMVQIGLHAAGIETDTQQRHIANLTRLLHMLLEVETDSKLNGSGYYGPFKAGMSGKEVRGTLEDLRTIRPIFEKFGYNKGVKLIDERLRREKNAAK